MTQYPDIYGNNVVWISDQLHLYQIDTGTTIPISADITSFYPPRIDRNHILWGKFENQVRSLYLYTIRTSPQGSTYQETSADISFSGDWDTINAAEASGGSYAASVQSGASALLTFTGVQVSLLYTASPDQGNIEITIDSGTPVLLDQHNASLSYQNQWDSPQLANGSHTITLRHPGGGHTINIDALIVSTSPDTTPPDAVTLQATPGYSSGEINLNWIAPGDDADIGTATEYIVRYANSAITSQAEWDAANDVVGENAPLSAGSPEGFIIAGLNPEQTYYFALRTLDEAGNISALSNSPGAKDPTRSKNAENPFQITNNWVNESGYKVYGDYAVWWSNLDGDDDIYLYQISTGIIKQITKNTADDDTPQIIEDYVVWESNLDGDWEIYLYQISTGTTVQVSNNTAQDHAAEVNGDYIVWFGQGDGDLEIYLYQISSGTTTQVSHNTAVDYYPQVDGDYVTWHGMNDGDSEIYFYQISAGITQKISNNTRADDVQPKINGDYIVWFGGAEADAEIYLYQISTGTIRQITSNNEDDYQPRVDGDFVVWYGMGDGDSEIYLYQISTNTTTQVSNNTIVDDLPEIDGDHVIWEGYSNGNWEIYLYRISTGLITQITNNSSNDEYPIIHGEQALWGSQADGDTEIYIFTLGKPVPAGTYQENNPNIFYTGIWTAWDHSSASGGTMYYSIDPEATASMTFTGRQVSLLYTQFTTRGEVEISIDGNDPVMLNQYGTELTFQNRWESPILEEGTHTIQLSHPGGSKYIDLDALIVTALESNPPAAVTLNATTGSNTGEIDLSWIAPGDDDNTGTATEYIVRYANAAIDSQSAWDAATEITGEPVPQAAGTAEKMTVSGLMPGQTHFFALRTIDDATNISAMSNSPSAEVKAPTPVEIGIYEENDDNIFYTGNWETWNITSASDGSTRYSNDPEATASLTFSGRQVSLLYTSYTSRGEIEIIIDGSDPVLLDQYGSTLSFQNRWDSPLMDAGTHTIMLRHPGGSHYIDLDAFIVTSPESDPPAAVTLNAITGSNTGEVDLNWVAPGDDGDTGTAAEYILRYANTAIDSEAAWDSAMDVIGEPVPQLAGTAEAMTLSGLVPGQTYFFALRTLDESANLSDLSNSPSAAAKPITPVTPGTYQNDNPNIAYTGNWTTWNTASASGGSTRYSNDPAASATLVFSGRQVSLLFTRYTTRGNIEVTIDGGTPVLLNQYGSTLTFQNRWDSPLMDSGTHTVVLRHPGGTKYIDLDALIISSPESNPPAAVTLSAATGSNLGQVNLNWNAPGDDDMTGTATSYIVRYAAAAIDTQAKWDAATDVTGEPTPLPAGSAQTMTVSGLTPGQTYYFALRTLDDSNNLSDLSTSPSAVAKAPTPVDPGTYQNDNPNIVYTGNWTTWNDARASGNSTRYSNDTTASATLTFTGRQVSLLFTRYTSRGNIEITIDGGTPVLLNQYGSSLTFQNRWDSPLMAAGTHTVEFGHPGGTKYIDLDAIIISDPESIPPAAVTLSAATGSSNGQVNLNWNAPGDDDVTGTATSYVVRYAAAAIDSQAKWDAATDVTGEPAPLVATTPQSMVVSGLTPGQTYYFALRTLDDSNNLSDLSNSPSAAAKSPTPVSPGTYQNDNPNIVYTGNWTPWNDSRASGGSTRYSNDPAATATLTFSGRQVSLLFTRYTSRGNIEITIDGGTPVLLNQYGAALTFQNRWDSPLMAAGTHTVKFSHPGGTKYIDLDAIIISDPESIPPAAVTLNAATGSSNGQVNLNWVSPGDDDMSGTAMTYIVRYAAAAIDTQAKWDAATDVTGEPTPLIVGTAQSMTVSSLTPGQTYYFALRSLDDSNNLSALSNSPSAAAKAPTPVNEGTYENENANIVYAGNWTVWNHASASSGSTRYSNDPAASATLTFSGRQVNLLFTRFTSRGNIEITIDGGMPMLLNQYGSTLTFQNRWDSPILADGTHTIVLRHPGGTKYIDLDALIISSPESDPPAAATLNAVTGSNTGEVNLDWIAPGDDGNTGTATEYIIRYADSIIDNQSAWDAAADVTGEPAPQVAGTPESLIIFGLVPGQTYFFALRTLDDSGNLSDLSNSPSAVAYTPPPVGAGIYQEDDANIAYTGNWTSWSHASASGGAIRYINQPDASATLTFTGRQVSLIFTRYTSRGEIEITIDGGTPVPLNQYGATLSFQNRWDSPALDAGTHTIRLRHPGGTKYIDIDAIEVRAEPQ